jgi:hypothetical protein
MASEAKAADVPAAAPEAATVKPVEEAGAAPAAAPGTAATTVELDKAKEAQAEAAAPAATNGNGVHGVQSELVEKDVEGLRDPVQKVCSLAVCSPVTNRRR